MNRSWRRTWAITRKELREYRRNRSVLLAVAVLPLIFLIQPVAVVLRVPAEAAAELSHRHLLLYMLAVPILAPAVLAAYSIAGERQQESLEPALSTPIRSDEFLAGKALAALLPAVGASYAVFALFLGFLELWAPSGIAAALVRGSDVADQLLLTPLLAALSTWIAMAVSTRMSDVRVAQQLALLANIPLVLLTSLVAFEVIPIGTVPLVPAVAGLLAADALGWRLVVPLFDRERLVTSR